MLTEKWDRIYSRVDDSVPQAAFVLTEYAHLLPMQGDALDLASGLGGNALFLARHGLETVAWDLSSVAIRKLNQHAEQMNLHIKTEVRDLETAEFDAASFDVIVVSRFLERKLVKPLISSLKLNGLLFYQTFTQVKVGTFGPNNPAFLLADNELLSMFKSLKLLLYREEGREGDWSKGIRNEALLIGKRIDPVL